MKPMELDTFGFSLENWTQYFNNRTHFRYETDGSVSIRYGYRYEIHFFDMRSDIKSYRKLRLHEASLQEYLTCIGVEIALREKISKAVPKEWLAGIQHKTTELSHLTIHDILTFVKSQGVNPKPVDVMASIASSNNSDIFCRQILASTISRASILNQNIVACVGIYKVSRPLVSVRY
jgi:hypothetical protein